jgi:hypothetical protein
MSDETPVFNEYFFGKVAAHAFKDEWEKIAAGASGLLPAGYGAGAGGLKPKKKVVPAAQGLGQAGPMKFAPGSKGKGVPIPSKSRAWNAPK